jgi:hypothetical protein
MLVSVECECELEYPLGDAGIVDISFPFYVIRIRESKSKNMGFKDV